VLGGLAAFGAVAFTQVLLGAFWQALHSPAAGDADPQVPYFSEQQ
jgi:hypothetical protein